VPESGAAPSFGDFMQFMKMFAASEAPTVEAPAPGARPPRTTLPKEQRKFQRYDREQVAAEKTAPVSPAGEAPTEEQTEGEAASSRAAVPPLEDAPPVGAVGRPIPISVPVGRRSKAPRVRRPLFWLTLQIVGALLLVAAFLLGRTSVPRTLPPPKPAAPAAPGLSGDSSGAAAIDPAAAKIIDEAMAAEQDRDFRKATDLLLKVQQDFPHVRDLDFHLANLALEENDPARALPLLNQSIAEGEQVAASYKVRGTVLNRKAPGRGMDDFESATKVDPFSAENFYFWGEALRRAGKPQAALVKLQQAMDRLREPALEAEYRLKIRLTQVELGQEPQFAAEMAQQLAQTPPPPEWLLTAAAIALQHRNFAQAADFLDKASHGMSPDLFSLNMRDYFFFGYRQEKQLAKFFTFANETPRSRGSSNDGTDTAKFDQTGQSNASAPGAGTLFKGLRASTPLPTPGATP
jgi:Tfp pilus assembly protein PilF